MLHIARKWFPNSFSDSLNVFFVPLNVGTYACNTSVSFVCIQLGSVVMPSSKCSYGSVISGNVGWRNLLSHSLYNISLSVFGLVSRYYQLPVKVAPVTMWSSFTTVTEMVVYSILG